MKNCIVSVLWALALPYSHIIHIPQPPGIPIIHHPKIRGQNSQEF